MESLLKKYLKPLLGIFFLFAGANHFANPEFYLPLIPDYLPSPVLLNVLSGLIEVALGVLLFVPRFTKLAAYGIMVFLVILIPSHIYFIQIGSCIEGGLCIPEWFAWVRLVVVQPLFILWAWLVSKN
jgi:uncharacterized membrane protein